MSGCIHESQRIKSSNSSQPRSCACMYVGVCVVRTSTSEIGMRGPLDNSCAGHSRWMQPLTNVSKNVKRMIGYLAKVNSLHRRSLGPQGRGSLCGCRRCWARCLACLALCKCENVKWSTSKLSKLALRVSRCCDHTRHNRIKMRYANRVRLPIPITTPDPQKTGRPVAHPIGQFVCERLQTRHVHSSLRRMSVQRAGGIWMRQQAKQASVQREKLTDPINAPLRHH